MGIYREDAYKRCGGFMKIKILELALNFIYPNVCGICNKIAKEAICPNCMNKMEKKLIAGRKVYIETEGKFVDENIYLFKYEDIIRQLIINYKFKEKTYLYRAFAYSILKTPKVMKYVKSYDILTSIPIHRKRKNRLCRRLK